MDSFVRIRKSFIAKCVCTHKEFVSELPVQKVQTYYMQHIIKEIENTNNE